MWSSSIFLNLENINQQVVLEMCRFRIRATSPSEDSELNGNGLQMPRWFRAIGAFKVQPYFAHQRPPPPAERYIWLVYTNYIHFFADHYLILRVYKTLKVSKTPLSFILGYKSAPRTRHTWFKPITKPWLLGNSTTCFAGVGVSAPYTHWMTTLYPHKGHALSPFIYSTAPKILNLQQHCYFGYNEYYRSMG